MHDRNLPGNAGRLPAIGLGTWRMGESVPSRALETSAVRMALEIGYRLIDTAEMYGEGGAESVVGEALRDAFAQGTVTRDDVCVVTKFYPHHAAGDDLVRACERSRARLDLDAIDVYLLHWRGSTPLQATVDGLESLRQRGWIRHWGVSNFDVDDLAELDETRGGERCATNQVWYSLGQRGVEHRLLPALRRRGLPLMAYSPIDQAELADHAGLRRLAADVGMTAAQLALAWLLRRPEVVAIPKARSRRHLEENFAAADVALTPAVADAIDRLFPAPGRATPLAIN